MPRIKNDSGDSTQAKADKARPRRAAVSIRLPEGWPTAGTIARIVIVTAILLFVAGYAERFITSLRNLFFLVILSVFFAYLLDPLVKLIRRPFKARGAEHWMPRSVAIVIAYVIVFTVLGIAISIIAPRVVEQAKEFAANVPSYATSARENLTKLNQRYDNLRIPEDVQGEINKKLSDYGSEIGAFLTGVIGGILLSSVTYLPWLVLVPVIAFFLLKDVNLIRLSVLRLFPAGRLRIRAESVLQDVNSTLAAYTRAQMVSCLVIGMICTIGFYALGLKYALLLGIMACIFEFVPLLGPATVAVVVVTTAALGDDPWKALYAAIFLGVLRVVQDYLLYPRIVRGGIHLHPLVIVLSVLAGEQIAGIPGVFISIPVVAVGIVIYRHVVDHRGERHLITSLLHDTEEKPTETA